MPHRKLFPDYFTHSVSAQAGKMKHFEPQLHTRRTFGTRVGLYTSPYQDKPLKGVTTNNKLHTCAQDTDSPTPLFTNRTPSCVLKTHKQAGGDGSHNCYNSTQALVCCNSTAHKQETARHAQPVQTQTQQSSIVTSRQRLVHSARRQRHTVCDAASPLHKTWAGGNTTSSQPPTAMLDRQTQTEHHA